MKEDKYILEVNRKQLELINQALASFTRLSVGQLKYGLGQLIWNPETMNQLNQKQIDVLKLIDSDHDYNEMVHINKDADILYDVHQVLRHQLWKENSNKSDITVDSSVTKLSSEELMILKKILE